MWKSASGFGSEAMGDEGLGGSSGGARGGLNRCMYMHKGAKQMREVGHCLSC